MQKTRRRIAVAQFRTGSLLQVEKGRWIGQSREERICRRCEMQVVDDERHMIFQCTGLDDIREQYSELYENVEVDDVRGFLEKEDEIK